MHRTFPIYINSFVRCIVLNAELEPLKWNYPAVRIFLRGDCPKYTFALLEMEEWIGTQDEHDFCQEVAEERAIEKETCFNRSLSRSFHIDHFMGTCQCDQACEHFHDCCLDVNLFKHQLLFPKTEEARMFPWLQPEVISALGCESIQYSQEKVQSELGFYMVNDCPAYKEKSLLQQHCRVNIDSDHILVAHHVPLLINGILYKNIYCAQCFGKDIRFGQLWILHVGQIIDEAKCLEILEEIRVNHHVSWKRFQAHCGNQILTKPRDEDYKNGYTRMGKVCIMKRHDSQESEEKLLAEICPNLSAEPPTVQSSRQQCGQHHNLPQNHTRGLVKKTETSDAVVVAKLQSGFKVMSNVKEICQQCDELSRLRFSASLRAVRTILNNHNGFSTDGTMSIFFDRSFADDCINPETCEGKNLAIPASVHVVISQTGSVISVTVLSGLVYLKRVQQSCKSKRIQLGLITSKILFFIVFCLSYWLRNLVCRVMAILLHVSLFLSFSYSIALGLNVSWMMWRLKHDLAAMAEENRNNAISYGEVLTHAGAVVVSCIGGGVLLFYEFLSNKSLFGAGKNQLCIVTDPDGIVYFVVIPTVLTLIMNLFTTGFSGIILYQIMNANQLVHNNNVSRLLLFLGRLVSFQSLQWALGLIHYSTQNEIVGLVFEILVSFEGVMIASSYFIAECRAKFK